MTAMKDSVLVSGIVLFCCTCVVNSMTTAFPEICRVMDKYRDCYDATFRTACPHYCSNIQCSGNASMIYYPSRGMCIGFTATQKMIWPYASEFCKAYGATLFPLKSAADIAILEDLVAKLGAGNPDDVHVGGMNIGSDPEWVYTDGSLVSQESNWENNYPQSAADGVNQCMNIHRPTFEQRNDNCNNNYKFMCAGTPTFE